MALAVLIIAAGCSQSLVPLGASGPPRAPSNVRSGSAASGYRVVHFFGGVVHGVSDGSLPQSGLIAWNGKFYGTTSYGGIRGGTIYSISPSGDVRLVDGFPSAFGPLSLYGGLVAMGSALYGTSSSGGSYQYYGTAFVLKAGKVRILHDFSPNNSDGQGPKTSLIVANGMLYGTTYAGGQYGGGTFFSMTPSGKLRILHSFSGESDGTLPSASVVEHDGAFYGTTLDGGAYNKGTIYKISSTGAETVLHSFSGGSDGSYPAANLIWYRHRFYGTTSGAGGGTDWGTVFSFTTGAPKTLYAFRGKPDGGYPWAAVTAFNGKLYGTTELGGTYNYGTIFELTLDGREKKLHDFQQSYEDGGLPDAPLLAVNGTTLWGTTTYGGPNSNAGTIYAITP